MLAHAIKHDDRVFICYPGEEPARVHSSKIDRTSSEHLQPLEPRSTHQANHGSHCPVKVLKLKKCQSITQIPLGIRLQTPLFGLVGSRDIVKRQILSLGINTFSLASTRPYNFEFGFQLRVIYTSYYKRTLSYGNNSKKWET